MKKQEFSIIVSLAILAIIISITSIITTNTNNGFLNCLTGHAVGNVTAYTDEMIVFEISSNSIDFGNITQGGSNDTISNGIAPFIINNTGNAKLDMTVTSANALLTGTSPTYAFNSSCYEASCAGTVYNTAWTSFTSTVAQDIVKILEFNNSMDELRIDLMIGVPLDEPAGTKTDTLTFTASEAEEGPGELPYIYSAGSKLYIYPNDSSGGIVWSPGSYPFTVTSAQSDTDGSANTATIVSVLGAGTYAAKTCSDLDSEGYSDWYLPAKTQLSTMYDQKDNVTKGGYAGTWADYVADFYWSSTEGSGGPEAIAWYVSFDSGGVDFSTKDYTYHVRCVRG